MAKKFYFTVFQYTEGSGYCNQEWAGDSHPFNLRERLIKSGVFRSAVILFFKEISKSEYLLFMENKKRLQGDD